MKTHHHPTTFVHLINQVGLLGICVALVVAFYYQLVRHRAALSNLLITAGWPHHRRFWLFI